MIRGLGLHRPDPAKLARRLRVARGAATPIGHAELEPCPRLDQGQSGTCHAHSAAGVIWTAYQAAGRAMAWIPSPREIAACTYADVRSAATGPGMSLPKLQDTGADLSDDASALATWGIAPMWPPTSDGRASDVENDPADNTFPEPDSTQLLVAGADLIAGEYQIPVDSSAPNLCALSLDAGVPIWLGFFVDSAFEQAGPSTVVGAPNQSDPSGGGHAVYLSGYRTAADGSFEFLLQNSWGGSWALNGSVWCSTAWLLATWIRWPFPAGPVKVVNS
jgi:hypothetical protein